MKSRHAIVLMFLITSMLSCNIRVFGQRTKTNKDNTEEINDTYHQKQAQHKSVNSFNAKKKRSSTASQPLSHKKKKRSKSSQKHTSKSQSNITNKSKDTKKFLFFFNTKYKHRTNSASNPVSTTKRKGKPKSVRNRTSKDRLANVYADRSSKKFLFFFNRKNKHHTNSASNPVSTTKRNGKPKSVRNRTSKERLANVYADRSSKKLLFFFHRSNKQHPNSASKALSHHKKKGDPLSKSLRTPASKLAHVYKQVKKKENKHFLFVFKPIKIRGREKPGFIGDTKRVGISKNVNKKRNYLNKQGTSSRLSRRNKHSRDVLQSGAQRKSTYEFSKKKRKVILKRSGVLSFLHKKSYKGTTLSKLSGRGTRGSYEFNKKKHAVVSKKGIFFFSLKNKRKREASYFSYKDRKKKKAMSFNKKHFSYVGKHGLLSSLFKGMKSHKTARYGPRGTIGSYHFNQKKKRVKSKKNFLIFFHVKKHEPETSSFSGGKRWSFLHFDKKNKHKTFKHKRPLFKKRNSSDLGSKRKLEMNLFSPKMRNKF